MYIVRRALENPILTPHIEHPWEMAAFNPSPIRKNGILHLLYRAQSRPEPLTGVGRSTIALAKQSTNGLFEEHRPFIVPSEPWDSYGCEDPRVTFFEGKYYIFYTALGGVPFGPRNIRVAVAISDDLETISEKYLVTPFNAKAMTLFPERINGEVTVLFSAHTDEPPSTTAIARMNKIEDLWNESFWNSWHEHIHDHALLLQRTEADHVEVGATPLRTKEGWLLVHSYMRNYYSDKRTFGIEAALTAYEHPQQILKRTTEPFLVPEEAYEVYGMIPKVVFPSGVELRNNTLDVYYGAADTVCARASLHLPNLLSSMQTSTYISPVVRSDKNPILTAQKSQSWESRLAFNPGAIDIDGIVYLLYRAMSEDNTSVLGFAQSSDGINFTRDTEPCFVPRADFELKKGAPNGNSGCEDPRVTFIEGRIYITYTAYNGLDAPAVAVSSISKKDFLARAWSAWTMPVLVSPSGVDDKDACILPRTFDGKYLFIHRISGRICADYFDNLSFDRKSNRCIDIMGARAGTWEGEKVGIAGVPFETEKGWVLIYHAVSPQKVYSLGVALLDKDDPTTVISRAVEPLMIPETGYEKYGEVPNVVFSNGAVVRGDTVFIYYGGADEVIGVATCSLSHLLDILTPPLL